MADGHRADDGRLPQPDDLGEQRREWREAGDMRVSKSTLAAVLGTAAFCSSGRWVLASYAVGVDEPEIMERVVNMMNGDFNPWSHRPPRLLVSQSRPRPRRRRAPATATSRSMTHHRRRPDRAALVSRCNGAHTAPVAAAAAHATAQDGASAAAAAETRPPHLRMHSQPTHARAHPRGRAGASHGAAYEQLNGGGGRASVPSISRVTSDAGDALASVPVISRVTSGASDAVGLGTVSDGAALASASAAPELAPVATLTSGVLSVWHPPFAPP